MSLFWGKTYWYPTANHGLREIGVCQGLGGVWMVSWTSDTGGRHRVKTPLLPVVEDPDDIIARGSLQMKLNVWATKRKLKLACPV